MNTVFFYGNSLAYYEFTDNNNSGFDKQRMNAVFFYSHLTARRRVDTNPLLTARTQGSSETFPSGKQTSFDQQNS